MNTCLKLSDGRLGDDATAVAMRVRNRRKLTILTGPPSDTALDGQAVARLMSAEGAKASCGGTTAQMAARVLGKELKVAWQPVRPGSSGSKGPKLPPVGTLEGVDLVTEDILPPQLRGGSAAARPGRRDPVGAPAAQRGSDPLHRR